MPAPPSEAGAIQLTTEEESSPVVAVTFVGAPGTFAGRIFVIMRSYVYRTPFTVMLILKLLSPKTERGRLPVLSPVPEK